MTAAAAIAFPDGISKPWRYPRVQNRIRISSSRFKGLADQVVVFLDRPIASHEATNPVLQAVSFVVARHYKNAVVEPMHLDAESR